jgi:hypothetical protein
MEDDPSQREVTEFHKHEALHTASIASDFFDRHLADHVAVQQDPEVKAAAEKISELLGDFYQLCGAKFIQG